jgi:CheY-like chemotaxis protein
VSSVVHILLVEDDEVDIEAIRRAFRKHGLSNPISIARDGHEALALLRGETAEKLGSPYMILLDLNMPRMNGHEFLDELRADDKLCDSIVFVLTTSDSDADKQAAYSRLVSGYMVKHRVGEEFDALVSLLSSYWNIVEFPS